MLPQDKSEQPMHLYINPETGEYVFATEDGKSSFVFPIWCYKAIREQIEIGHIKIWKPNNG